MRLRGACAVCVLLLLCGRVFAGDSLAGVGEVIASGRAGEARTRLVKARDAFAAQHDQTGEAVTVLLIAMADGALRDANAARANFDRAVSMFVAAGDRYAVWLALTLWAAYETESGHPRDAIPLHQRAIQLLQSAPGPHSQWSAKVVEMFAIAFGASPESLAATSEIGETVVIPLCELASHLGYGQTLLAAGELEQADDELTAAAAKAAMYGEVLDGALAGPMGDLRKRQRRFDDAREYYEIALHASMPALPMFALVPSREIEILAKLAEVDVLTGRVDEGLALSERELTLARDSKPASVPWILIQRGSLLQQSGRIRDAENAYAEALAAGQSVHDEHSLAAAHTMLGMLHYYAGNYGNAASEYVKAIEDFQRLNEGPAETVLWTLLANVYLATDSRAAAAEAAGRAKELANKNHFSAAGAVDFLDAIVKWRQGEPVDLRAASAALWAEREAHGFVVSDEAKRFMADLFALNVGMKTPDPALISGDGVEMAQPIALMMTGVPLAARGDYEGARAVWSRAKALFNSADVDAVFDALIGSSYIAEGRIEDAIRCYTRSLDALETVASDARIEEMLTSYLGSERHGFYDTIIGLLVRDGRPREAFDQTERARARAFLQMIGNRRIGKRGADPRLVDEADRQRHDVDAIERKLRSAATHDEAALLQHELIAARHKYEALMVRVKLSNPEYAALTTVQTLPSGVIQGELPERTTLVAYFVTRDVVHAWVLDTTSFDAVVLPIDATALRRLTCWARRFSLRPDDDPRGVKALGGPCSDAVTADEAYEMLIAPLRAKIRNQRLMILPHRELHYVPFAALHDPEKNRYLIEDYTIVYTPSASAWQFLRRREPHVSHRALVLGDPQGSMGSLEGAAREARMVAARLGTTPLVGTSASERVIHDRDPAVDLLHIAAHARYDGANPLFSFIALSPDGEEYDGQLEAQEILADVDLAGVNLVVVSACSTATGKPSAGDEIVAVTRALLYAGTPAVLSTLWEINDSASAVLMDSFYEQLVCGLPAADALREAQLAMLRGGEFSSPEYWAPFTLNGDPDVTWRASPAIPR